MKGNNTRTSSATGWRCASRADADCAADFAIPCHGKGKYVVERLRQETGATLAALWQAGKTDEIGVLTGVRQGAGSAPPGRATAGFDSRVIQLLFFRGQLLMPSSG
jgi:hypothetical protein